MDVDAPPAELIADDLYMGLGVNSMVEVTLAKENAHGIIRWVGHLTGRREEMAGLELVMFLCHNT